MSNSNPYQTPEAKIELTDDDVLASRSSRFWAAVLDTLIGCVIAIPLALALGMWDYMKVGREAPLATMSLYVGLSMLGYLLVHGYLLQANGQTVGKKLVGIRIVDMKGVHPGFARIYFMRYLPVALLAFVPGVGPLLGIIDVLLIFKGDRRCAHDMLAGTQVVRA